MRTGGRETVVVFGAEWCGDCRLAKAWLRDNDVPFTDIDVEHDADARHRAIELARGRTNIPVVVLPGGAVLVEPSTAELASALLPNAI